MSEFGASGGRLHVHYRLSPGPGESAERKLEDIAWEQTVEVPRELPSAAVRQSVVGRVESLRATGDGRWDGVVSYSPDLVHGDVGGLVNLLLGNLSMGTGVRVEAVDWPTETLSWFSGPNLGIAGLRRMADASRRPLLCGVAKPLGLETAELARLCGEFARGGADFVKDDHSLADQPTAPFEDRVRRCLDAVGEANARTGGRCRYFPHLPADPATLEHRLDLLDELGVEGVLVLPLVCGLGTVRHVATSRRLAVLGHPAFTGWMLGAEHGIAPGLLFGEIFRLAGCDAVIFANPGGRFGWSLADADDIVRRARRPLGPARPAFPVPAGGVAAESVPEWVTRYGLDTMLVIGGSLLCRDDLAAATAELVAVLEDSAVQSGH